VPRTEVKAIGISLPLSSVGREISNGRTSIPDQIGQTERTRYFPPPSSAVDHLEVAYDVPPTELQKLVLVYGGKAVAAIIVPLLGLLLLDTKDIVKPKMRTATLWAGALMEIVVLFVVTRVAFVTGGDRAVTAIADLAVVGLGAVFSAVVLLVKRKPTIVPPAAPSASYQRGDTAADVQVWESGIWE